MDYPTEWETTFTTKNRLKVVFRPEQPTDTEMLWTMFSTLSKKSASFLLPPFSKDRIESWTTDINYDEVLAIVAVVEEKSGQRIIGSASLEFNQQEALKRGLAPIREFMFKQARPKDVMLFQQIAKLPQPHTPDDVPLHVLIPGFVISELRIAFQIGFIIYIPFLIIDMVVASTLMAMGMMMLPPVFISLPFKIILFVLADGWFLLTGELVRSFH